MSPVLMTSGCQVDIKHISVIGNGQMVDMDAGCHIKEAHGPICMLGSYLVQVNHVCSVFTEP